METDRIKVAESPPEKRAPFWITLNGRSVNIYEMERWLQESSSHNMRKLAARYETTPPTLYRIFRKHNLRTRHGEVHLATLIFDGVKYSRDKHTGYFRATRAPHLLMQQAAYIKYHGAIPTNSTVHFLNGDKADVSRDNLVACAHGIKHDRRAMSLQRRDMSPCYMVAGDMRVFVRIPDDNEFGFSLVNEVETFPGGLGLLKPLVKLPADAWQITEDVRRRLGYILEGAKELYKEEG